jgi:O-antigen/teichoic acid export membrane protein
VHSALWSVFQQLIRQAFVSTFIFVLARRVTPLEFGLVGIANIWNNFLTLFLELGFCALLVQRKVITPAHIASGFVLNTLFGGALMLATMIFSGPITALMKAPQAQPVLFTVSISFLVTGVVSLPIALAQRTFRFKELALRDCVAQSVAAGVGIILAFASFGVWAVVANSLLVNLVFLALTWRLSPLRIDLREITREAFREVWSFGSKVFGSTALKYFFRSADSILVGILFGPEKLGLYNFSQRVTAAPTKAIQFGLASYLFPKASEVQENQADLKEIFVLSFKVLNYLLLTFSILLATVGGDLLVAFFGEQWKPAIKLIRILILIQLLAPAVVPLSELMKAVNKPNWLLWWSVVVTALTLGALTLGGLIDFESSAIALAAAWCLTIPILIWIARRITGVTAAEFWRRVRVSYFLPIVMAGVLLAAYVISNGAISVMISIGIIAVAIEAAIAWFADGDIRELVRNIKFRKP